MGELDREIGELVTVTNPSYPSSTWTGELVAYRDHPCVTLEFENGERVCLPAAWVDPGGG